MATSASRIGTLIVGSSVGSAVIAAVTAGTLVLTSNTVTDKANNAAPGRGTGSGSQVLFFDKYQEQQLTTAAGAPSGATTSGSMANQLAAFILNDSTSGSVIRGYQLDCGSKYTAQNMFVAITPDTKSGTGGYKSRLIMGRRSFGSGTTFVGSGVQVGMIWPKQQYLIAVSASASNVLLNGNPPGDCYFRVWYDQKAVAR